jgi:CRISPR-associated protein Cas1
MKDIIYIEHKNKVTLKDKSICFENIITTEKKYILYEEISVLIFVSQESYVSNEVINICVDNDIMILFCDYKHSPTALISSEFGYFNKLYILEKQFAFSSKSKNRLWSKIIKSKIINQADVLKYFKNINESEYKEFVCLAKEVTEGDRTAREAVVAKKYFKIAFGEKFIK